MLPVFPIASGAFGLAIYLSEHGTRLDFNETGIPLGPALCTLGIVLGTVSLAMTVYKHFRATRHVVDGEL
jgi:hypothetical protein